MQNKNKLSNYNQQSINVLLLRNVKYFVFVVVFGMAISCNAQQMSLQVNVEFKVNKGVVEGRFCSLSREAVVAPNTSSASKQDEPGDFKIEIVEKKHPVNRLYFSSLAAEWARMCHADSCKIQLFSESFRMSLPHSAFCLRLKMREDESGKWRLLDSVSVNPVRLVQSKVILHQIKDLSPVLNSPKGINLIFVPDGYGLDSSLYYSDCQKFANGLFAATPYDSMRNFIHAFAVFYPKDTSSICTFSTLGIPRYLSVNKRFELARRLAGIQADHIIVISKSEEYGGSGFYNNYAVVSSSNQWSVKVFLHEFGHSFGGLGDEYVTDTAFCVVPQAGIDCVYPNVSSLPNGKVKWAKFMKKSTPIPTPILPQFGNEVGVYQGASYCPQGLYRPYQKCLMRELTPGKYCPVCKDAIIKRLTK